MSSEKFKLEEQKGIEDYLTLAASFEVSTPSSPRAPGPWVADPAKTSEPMANRLGFRGYRALLNSSSSSRIEARNRNRNSNRTHHLKQQLLQSSCYLRQERGLKLSSWEIHHSLSLSTPTQSQVPRTNFLAGHIFPMVSPRPSNRKSYSRYCGERTRTWKLAPRHRSNGSEPCTPSPMKV
jgi:hypothetical protein